jgi:hypothetical protein
MMEGCIFPGVLGFGKGQIDPEANKMSPEIPAEQREWVAAFSRACAPVQVPPYRL